MTITVTSTSVTYTGNGATTEFAFNFPILDAASLNVWLYEIATKTYTVLTSASYTASGLGDDAGGSVTYPNSGSPMASTHQLIIFRDTPKTQTTNITNQTTYYASSVMAVWDKLTMLAQEAEDRSDRALRIERTDDAIGTLVTGAAADRAQKLVGFDVSGDPVLFTLADINIGGLGTLEDLSITGTLDLDGGGRIWIDTDDADAISGQPFFRIAEAATGNTSNHMLVRQDTDVRSDATMVFFQRNVETDDGHSNPKALRAVTNINVDVTQTEWAISGEVNNYSDTSASGFTAVSGVINKYGEAGGNFGGHFQAKDWIIESVDTDVKSIIGVEANTPAVGSDHPTANSGTGRRRVLDVIARTNESVANWNTAGGNDGDAEIGVGVNIRSDSSTNGTFRYGLNIQEGNTAITTGARISTTGAYGLQLAGVNTTAQIYMSGNATNGIILSGNYTNNAIRIEAQEFIAYESTGNIKMGHGVTSNVLGVYNGSDERAGFLMTASPALRIDGKKVVGARVSGWSTATGTATRSSFATSTVTTEQLAERVKALIDDFHASNSGHALIGTT